MVTQAQKKATAKYNLANYDRLNIRLEKNQKDVLRIFVDEIEKCANTSISTNKFLCYLIDEALKKNPSEFADKF